MIDWKMFTWLSYVPLHERARTSRQYAMLMRCHAAEEHVNSHFSSMSPVPKLPCMSGSQNPHELLHGLQKQGCVLPGAHTSGTCTSCGQRSEYVSCIASTTSSELMLPSLGPYHKVTWCAGGTTHWGRVGVGPPLSPCAERRVVNRRCLVMVLDRMISGWYGEIKSGTKTMFYLKKDQSKFMNKQHTRVSKAGGSVAVPENHETVHGAVGTCTCSRYMSVSTG